MSKGTRTRERLVAKAAALFNQTGYQATSIADVMGATGLQKGGIYRHFDSKEALAEAALDFALATMRQRFVSALAGKTDPLERLRAVIGVYARFPDDPPIAGGCPVLNAAVEADDTNPELIERAKNALDDLRQVIETAVQAARDSGQMVTSANPASVASLMLASLEGAIMLTSVYRSNAPMCEVVHQLDRWLEAMCTATTVNQRQEEA